MHHRIVNLLESNKTLYESQYGFRSGRSCKRALLNAQNRLSNSLSKKSSCIITSILPIDFSKAFDVVEHDILLRKLTHYGIRGNVHIWMKLYLNRRNNL